MKRLFGLAPFVGLIAFAIALIIQFASNGFTGWSQNLLVISLTYLVGVQGFVTGSGHLFFPDPIASSIGWQKSPFQWEVGLANISYGVLGVMSGLFGSTWWLAAIVAFSIFYLGAAGGHVREMVAEKDFAPGNAGFIFYYDIIVPIYLVVLYIIFSVIR